MKTYKRIDQKNAIEIILNLPEENSEMQLGYISITPLNVASLVLIDLAKKIIACQKVDSLYIKTNFQIMKKGDEIRIFGNLFNAFDMMSERELIDPDVTQSLKGDPGFSHCMELTKTIALEDELQLQTKQTLRQFKSRLPTLVDDLLSELHPLSKKDSGKWLLLIINRKGFSLAELQQLATETYQPSTPGMALGDS